MQLGIKLQIPRRVSNKQGFLIRAGWVSKCWTCPLQRLTPHASRPRGYIPPQRPGW